MDTSDDDEIYIPTRGPVDLKTLAKIMKYTQEKVKMLEQRIAHLENSLKEAVHKNVMYEKELKTIDDLLGIKDD